PAPRALLPAPYNRGMSYTVREVAAMLGLTPSQVRAYAARGFLEPERGNRGELRFGFRDLIILRTAGELVAAHIPQRKVQRALEVDPDHSDAHVNLGRMLHEEGAPLAAQQHYRRALETDPSHPTAAFNLGVALEDLGRLNEARNAYLRALDLDPENADAHYN